MKNSEQENSVLQLLTQFTLEHIDEAVFWVLRSGQIYTVNAAACELLCYNKEELYHKTIFDIQLKVTSKDWSKDWQRLKSAGSLLYNSELLDSSGKLISVSITQKHFIFKNFEFSCYIANNLATEKKYLDLLKRITFVREQESKLTYYRRFAKVLADFMKCESSIITRFSELSKSKLESIVFVKNGQLETNIEYDIANTPCERVLKGQFSSLKFDNDYYFNGIMKIKSYYGVPLIDANLETIGHLAVMSKNSYTLSSNQVELLKVFANNFNTELLRISSEEKLSEVNNQLLDLKCQLENDHVYLKEEINNVEGFTRIVTKNKKFINVLNQLKKVANSTGSVLIQGETGVGKELLARTVHENSQRRNRPLVKINCAALPTQLIESELFGHVKGSFTGAYLNKKGKFEIAHNGTIFLDEIGELPVELQPKLLRVLQEGEIEKIGSTESIKVDVRIIAATNKDLQDEVRKGNFRADLYYRINVFPVLCPSLRERKDDIEGLVMYFIEKYAVKNNKRINSIDENSIKKLNSYHWPGNIRELENVIERAVILNIGSTLVIDDLFLENGHVIDNKWSIIELEKNHILRALDHTHWKIAGINGAANLLGLKATTLEARMKKYSISRTI